MSLNSLEAFFAYMATDWHWLIALVICSMISGAVKGAFTMWSRHRIAMVKARRPVILPSAGDRERGEVPDGR